MIRITGEIVIAYQNFVAGTPVDLVHFVPPSVVADNDDAKLLRSHTRICDPSAGSTTTEPGQVKGHESFETVLPPSVVS